jgi:hypothetical protein
MIFREFQDCVCAGLAWLAEDFTSPADDWASLAFLEDQAGQVTVVPLGAAAGQPEVLVALSRHERARKLATSAPGWVCGVHAEATTASSASTRPYTDGLTLPADGLEVLWVVVLDEERTESWIAPIARDQSGPPRLGEWVCTGEPAGPLVDPLKQALR